MFDLRKIGSFTLMGYDSYIFELILCENKERFVNYLFEQVEIFITMLIPL